MFPLTHLYTAKTVLGKENPLTVAGCLFPDFGSAIGIGRNLCHECGVDMYYYAKETAPDHLDFALGAMTHGTALPGIDWYADEEYHGVRPGFCFQKGELIAADVAEACNLPAGMALWKTHNIIELAFDVLTEERDPGIGQRALRALPEKDAIFCTSFLESYLRRSDREIRKMFYTVPDTFSFDGNNIDEMADKFIRSLKKRHNIEGCDKDRLMMLIDKAVTLVEPLYDDFMEETFSAITSALQKQMGKARP